MPFVHNQSYVLTAPTPNPIGVDNAWYDTIYNADTFVLVGGDNSNVAYSSNSGQSWNSATLPIASGFGIAFGNTRYVAVGPGTRFAYSINAASWTLSSTVLPNLLWQDVAFGNNIFVAVAQTTGGGSTATYAYSSDGISWTTGSLPTSATWITVTFGNGLFIAFSEGGTYVTSSNGVTWSSPGTGLVNQIQKATYGGGYYVVVGSGQDLSYSTNGTTWTNRSINLGPASYFYVAYGAGTWVITGGTASTGNQAVWATSPAGTWSVTTLPNVNANQIYYPTAYGTSGRPGWIAAGYYSNPSPISLISLSVDGKTWV